MKENFFEIESNDDKELKEKHQKLLELYYNSNLSTYAHTLKKSIPDLDSNYDNKFIRKNDKLWVETNLTKLLEKASEKVEKTLLSKNQLIKITIDRYLNSFQSVPSSIRFEIKEKRFDHEDNELRNKKKANTLPCRNQSFSIENVNSEPSCSSINTRKALSSKRVFRVREFKNNFQEIMINNTRYAEKLEKVKFESTFAEFFFQKDTNPEEPKVLKFEKTNLDKIKLMANIRWNFNPSQKLEKIQKPSFQTENENLSNNLGFELRKLNFYKPKSKCQPRNNKVFVNI